MNRNHSSLIFARRYWNCSAMENLRCLNSTVSAVMMKQFYKTAWSSIKAFCLTKYKLRQKHMKFIYRFHANVERSLRLSG